MGKSGMIWAKSPPLSRSKRAAVKGAPPAKTGKRSGWINIYSDRSGDPKQVNASDIYLNKADAESPANRAGEVVACIRVEWEAR